MKAKFFVTFGDGKQFGKLGIAMRLDKNILFNFFDRMNVLVAKLKEKTYSGPFGLTPTPAHFIFLKMLYTVRVILLFYS